MSETTNPQTDWLTVQQAAKYCRVHRITFMRLAKQEGLRADGMVGKRNRYRIASLDKFMATMRKRSEAGAR